MTLPIVQFKRIKAELPILLNEMQTRQLSTDQRYLYEMCEAISTGVVSQSLAERHPGNLSRSRWITLANNALRKYVRTLQPSIEFETFVTFIIKAYAPTWFHIKINHKCTDGAPNLHYFIQASRYLALEYRNQVDASIQRNAFYTHPENILIAMLNDDQKEVRHLAYQRIATARASHNRTSFKSSLHHTRNQFRCRQVYSSYRLDPNYYNGTTNNKKLDRRPT